MNPTRHVAGAARRGSLIIVGTGITLVRQITVEALEYIQRAEKLFYLVPNPAVAEWLRELNPSAESLGNSYSDGRPRHDTYAEIADRILKSVRGGLQVCAAFYGHPGVLVQPSREALTTARREGFAARMLPGVSAEDCLFADISVSSTGRGWQSFEATDFLAARRRFDPGSALILWQVGLLGEASVREGMSCRPERLRVLTQVLRRHYPGRHPVILYEAAQFPICDPTIERTILERLPHKQVLPAMTLYVPPRPSRPTSRVVARWLAE
ncbi:MAG: hypothetical protein LC753_07965 [Acidobacteria bacterium]|nr:hypothetical protein [Acidobacteriota bacterium]